MRHWVDAMFSILMGFQFGGRQPISGPSTARSFFMLPLVASSTSTSVPTAFFSVLITPQISWFGSNYASSTGGSGVAENFSWMSMVPFVVSWFLLLCAPSLFSIIILFWWSWSNTGIEFWATRGVCCNLLLPPGISFLSCGLPVLASGYWSFVQTNLD
jgi:hypothetical protein